MFKCRVYDDHKHETWHPIKSGYDIRILEPGPPLGAMRIRLHIETNFVSNGYTVQRSHPYDVQVTSYSTELNSYNRRPTYV